MNEIDFRNWLLKKGIKSKVASDNISRLKKIENELNHCDIDYEYKKDNCKYLLSLFVKKGINDEMQRYKNVNFPIGKYSLGTYRYAIHQYIRFLESK